jgi:hypothetical protein
MNDIELQEYIMKCYGRFSTMLDDIHQQQMIFNYNYIWCEWYSSKAADFLPI